MSENEGKPVGRRVMLSMLGLGAAGIAAAPALQGGWQKLLDADPVGVTELLPNGGGFRYYSVTASVPVKNEANYRLTIDGLVDKPRTFTLAELNALPQRRVVHDVQCTDGWKVENAAFTGCRCRRCSTRWGCRRKGRRFGSRALTACTRKASRWSRPADRMCWWR
ncbi:molybdopterin-dependent oxidoreductase [Kutzneria kofuensis]|uniref:molybdopterin-dependent oxidoreductase n=1 Tax=Kutzneria kofuensis TaxID=103725 RepID=UPI0031E51898